MEVPPSVGRAGAEKEQGAAQAEEAAAAPPEQKNGAQGKALARAYLDSSAARERFTDDQIRILYLLAEKAMIVDDLAEETQIPVRRVLSALTFLEIEKAVVKGGGNRYSLGQLTEE